METTKNNIFANIPATIPEELFENLLVKENLKIERIVSYGQVSPIDAWYEQFWDEWVLLLQGSATLEYPSGKLIDLHVGDHVYIPAHSRHRVHWTPPNTETIWLAIHSPPNKPI